MNIRNLLLLALTSTVLVFAAACGDSDDGGNNGNNGNNGNTGDVVRQATLENVDGTPAASGDVMVTETMDGTRYVVLASNFMQQMGPGDTEVRLAKGDGNINDQMDADASNVSEAIGVIPNGASGSYSYEIPAGVTDTDFSHVVVWCPTAEVNFAVGMFSDAN